MRPDMYSSFVNTTSVSEAAAAEVVQNRSPWHSPVPYLFGGLAAMLGLIAFALLILACSYWKLSGYFESNAEAAASAAAGNHDQQHDQGAAGGGRTTDDVMMMMKPLESLKICGDYEEKIVVIMAGEQKPTFLAKPIKSSSSFKTADLEAAADDQVKKEGFDDQMGDDDDDDQTKKDSCNLDQEEHDHEHGNHHHHDHVVIADLDIHQFVGGGADQEYYSADRHA